MSKASIVGKADPVTIASQVAWEAFEQAESLHHDGLGYLECDSLTKSKEQILLDKFKQLRVAWSVLGKAITPQVRERLNARHEYAVTLGAYNASGNFVDCVYRWVEMVLVDFHEATSPLHGEWYLQRRTAAPPLPTVEQIRDGREQIKLLFGLYKLPDRDLVREELLKEVGRLPRREESPPPAPATIVEGASLEPSLASLMNHHAPRVRDLATAYKTLLSENRGLWFTLEELAEYAGRDFDAIRSASKKWQAEGVLVKAPPGGLGFRVGRS
jgi:hypothetical protein